MGARRPLNADKPEQERYDVLFAFQGLWDLDNRKWGLFQKGVGLEGHVETQVLRNL